MGLTSSRQSAAAALATAACACAAALALAAPAQSATASYPAGGSTFDSDPQGWAGSATACTLTAPLCTVSNVHSATEGNPAGSIDTQVATTIGALGLITGSGTWTSPSFSPAIAGGVAGASFAFDRRVDSGGGVDLTPTSEISVALVDETVGTSTPILTETLTTVDSTFTTREVAVPAAAIVAGHSYRIQIATTTSSSVIGLFGQANTRFDNVRLAITDGSSGGPGGPGGPGTGTPNSSPGVKVVRGPYGDAEIASLIDRYDDVDAEKGSGPGGSLIPLAACTIVGTSGPDRISGTSGNDVICGLGGNDVITGVGGRDAIDAAAGNDRPSGGIGGDLLLGLAGNDRLDGGGDADRIGGGAGRDRIESGNGKDLASGGSGNDSVGGAAGNDNLRGLAGNDSMNGGPGRDRLAGGSGNDVLRGLSGADVLLGGPGSDRLLLRDGRRDGANGGPGRDRALADRVDRVRSVERLSRS